jgi:hypothetical protein
MGLREINNIAPELQAFRYEWKPKLSVVDDDSATNAARDKFAPQLTCNGNASRNQHSILVTQGRVVSSCDAIEAA